MMVSTLRKLLLPFCLLCVTWAGSAHAAPSNDPLGSFLFTDGQVNAILRVGGSIYVGGAFTKVLRYFGSGVVVDNTNGVVDPAFPKFFGVVQQDSGGIIQAVIPDGAGGWFVGGEFTVVGTTPRNRLAHIKADKTLDLAWDPNVSGPVRALVLKSSTNTLYFGGDFKTVGVLARNRIAAVNAITGALDPNWNPNAHDTVRTMALSNDGSTLFVGGEFNSTNTIPPNQPSIGGALRNYIAEIRLSDGLATAWDPNSDNNVRTIGVDGSTVYVGGGFNNIGGQPRNSLAALDASTGLATAWNPNPDGLVRTLKKSGTIVYVGGGFTHIGSQASQPTRNRLAAINATTGVATDWDPNASNTVNTIEVVGSTVYVGGSFTFINGTPLSGVARNNAAALDANTNTNNVKPWNPNLNLNGDTSTGTVVALAAQSSTVFIGGLFNSAGAPTLRNNLAAFDAITGAVLPAFNPNVTGGSVLALAALGNTLYFGGDFTCIGGTGPTPCSGGGGIMRNRIASTNGPSGALSGWAPNANGTVRTLAVGNGATAVYAGGDFTNIASVGRNRIARLSASAPVNPGTWNPGSVGADNSVYTIVPAASSSGDKIYAGGSFTTFGGQARSNLAFVSGTGSGTVQNWNPGANGLVRALLVGTPTICTAPSDPAKPSLITPVYVGGDFTCLQGTDTTSCSNGGGFGRNHIAAIKNTSSQSNATICTWNPGADNTVRALAQSGNHIFAGGDFTSIGLGVSRNRLAALDSTSGSALSPISGEPGGAVSWNPNVNNSVNALAVAESPSPARLYVGGAFSTMAGSASIGLPRNNLAAFSYAPLVAAALPTGRSVQVGTTATAWALIINTDTSTPATSVGIAPNGFISPSDFSYQAVDPISAPPNTPINLPPGVSETFLIAITPSTTLVPSLVPFIFEGTNTNAAPQFNAVNTLLFSASTTPTPDIIAQPVTDTGGGIVDIPGPTGTGYIAVATTNVGVGGTITVEANTGSVSLPVTLTICQINPITAACINPLTPGPSATMTIAAGENDAFLVTVKGSGTIPFDPSFNRVLIYFHDGSTTNPFGPVRGGTSVAVRTQ